MKYCITIALCTLLALCFATSEDPDVPKALNYSTHNSGNLLLEVSNMGTLEGLTYPANSENSYIYKGAHWISAKKYRRDELGRKLYWLASFPTMDSSQVVTTSSPLWTPLLRPVIDSLTTEGYDGDANIHELLPADNPLSYDAPNNAQNSPLDNVLTSILGLPGHRPFSYPDPQGSYLFTVPTSTPLQTPSFETKTAYFYDFCPFGTVGQRDYGTSSNTNDHRPLQIAIEQKSYSWGLQNFANFVILENTLWNCNPVDTLFQVSLASYMDCDIGPLSWGSYGAIDDVSGYVCGEGYEFAYSRDSGGIAGIVGLKIIVPNQNLERHAWFWKVGDGANDAAPAGLYPSYSPRKTPNEKYWLMTGRNPSSSKFSSLIPMGGNMQYEQPVANDTRYLYSVCKDDPAAGTNRYLNIAPGQSLKYYTVIFAGNSIDELKARSLFAESFISSGFEMGNVQGLTCIPYIRSLTRPSISTIDLNWHSYTDPNHFEVKYKLYDAPASDWQTIYIAGNQRSGNINDLQYQQIYKIKVAAVYNSGASEVYLESQTHVEVMDDTIPIDESLQVLIPAINYPNPFNPSTTIRYDVRSPEPVQINIYNLKGQLVKRLFAGSLSTGNHESVWDGTDDNSRELSSGIYLCRITQGGGSQTLKMLLLK
ncbi:MAG: hypothetical protein CVU48_07630 [Candidatus Cloacimonetes bacterium HGW-Cloacimonetes-1]|nr:MAG: hypothetical protein CVU48_07630 [Candidatus Cloacimonetes bacterium HGW-Cloacimonetes-1]